MATLLTTLGPKRADELGMILPHEHIFVDLGPIEAASYRQAQADAVVARMGPEVEKIKAQGITVLVECTPEGVGRRADIDLEVSRATDFPIVLPTGIYREPWVPQWAQDAAEEEIAAWMIRELSEEIAGTGVPAAWIKVSAGDEGITPLETKILRAAARAGAATGAIIGSHTIRGRVVRDQLAIIEQSGYRADRFIWIHTQAEPDPALHLEMAQRGVWLEYDAIGSEQFDDAYFVKAIRRVFDAGFGARLLVSQDRGWYDPSKPGGGPVKPFTYLADVFLPKLRAGGFDDAALRQLTHTNPFDAYSREIG